MASNIYRLVSFVAIFNIALIELGNALRVVTSRSQDQLNVTCIADDAEFETYWLLSINIIKPDEDESIFLFDESQRLRQGPAKKDNMNAVGNITRYLTTNYLTVMIDNPTEDDATDYRCQVYYLDENLRTLTKDAYGSAATHACPNGWTHYTADNKCFKIYGKEDYRKYLTWDDARNECQRYGGDLVQIRDENKNNFVLNMTAGLGYGPFIGIKNVAETGYEFQYGDGTPLGSYHPWSKGNPSGDGSQDIRCVAFSSGNWHVDICRNRHPYVCSIHSE